MNDTLDVHQPLDEVRKTFHVDWYRCPIDRTELMALLERSDLRGWCLAAGHLVLFACTGSLALYCFNNGIWLGFAVALFAHGTVASFFPVSPVHELGHGTVFKTHSLNRFFLYVYSFLGWWNHHEYAMSHTFHHRYTLHPRGDREVVLPRHPSLKLGYLVQLFTFNVFGGTESTGFLPRVTDVFRTARGGYRSDKSEWFPALYAGHPEERRRAVNWARWLLAFHLSVIGAAAATGLWILPVLISLPVFTANALRYFVGMPMHCGLRNDVPDFRLCVRSITLNPISEFLYWHMNWHTEHHMFAAVPCYHLPRLSEVIAADMPTPRTLGGAWREMREVWRRQQTEPDYQFDTPLPSKRGDGTTTSDPLSASIGEIAPQALRS